MLNIAESQGLNMYTQHRNLSYQAKTCAVKVGACPIMPGAHQGQLGTHHVKMEISLVKGGQCQVKVGCSGS